MALARHIPNTITSMNLVCGLIGVMFVFQSRLDLAFYWMLAAAVCDFLDGFAARLLHAGSGFGKELDSLCDLVSFGLLPGLMLCELMRTYRFGNESLLCWLPLLLALFSALRLARFNTDDEQAEGFLGLPTPACGLLAGALCCYCCQAPAGFLSTWVAGPVFIPVLALCLCALLVCRVPMFSFKFHRSDGRALMIKRLTLVAFIVVSAVYCLLTREHWSLAVVFGFTFYILNNLVYASFKL